MLIAVILAGCASPDTPASEGGDAEPISAASAADAPAALEPKANASTIAPPPSVVREIDVSYEGRLPEQICTFGELRHACDPVPGAPPSENILMELPAEGAALRVAGSIALEEMAGGAERVDLYLYRRDPGGDWTLDYPNDPYVSGASPQSFDWDLTPYTGQEFAFYVFASNAVGAGPVGVSREPSQAFVVTATLTVSSA